MSTLVTGAGGFLGSHVLEKLLESGEEIVCVDSFTHNGTTDAIADLAGGCERVSVIRHDLTAPLSARQVKRYRHVTRIIDCASLCSVPQSIAEPASFILNNVAVTVNVLELARVWKVEHVVHVSTDEVHGPDATDGHHPSSPYAASKAAQDDICHAYATTYGVPVSLVRPSNMFGERQSQLAFIPQLIKAALEHRQVDIHYHGSRPGGRWYVYAGNVADYIVGMKPGEWEHNLTGQQYVNNVDLVGRVKSLTGLRLCSRIVDGGDVRPGYDPQYQERTPAAGWDPQVGMGEAFARTVEWFMNNRAWLEA